jgi:probable HAF family extracellular repeat protein
MKRISIVAGLAALAVGASGVVAAAAGATASTAAKPTYTFTDIVNPADTTFNQALGINDQQVIVGYYGSGADPAHPNVGYNVVPPYGSANFTTQNFPGAVQTQVVAINDRAQTAGFYVDGAGKNIGWVKMNGTFKAVSDPAGPQTFDQLLGLNNNGVAAGFYNDAANVSHGYIYDTATKSFTPIAPPGASNSTVTGVNDQGQVAGFYTDSDGDIASFVDTNGSFATFELNSTSTQAFGINDTGTVVGTWTGRSGRAHGFVWQAGKAYLLSHGQDRTIVNGINNGGSIVGFYLKGAVNVGFVAVPSITQP